MALIAPPPSHPTRVVFLGTPDVAIGPLRALYGAGFEIAQVVSRADTRRGRGSASVPSPVKAAALELGLPVTDSVEDVLGVGAELGVVVAFGQIIRPHVLAALPMVNLHFSLLPRWRGAAPVERAILAGDTETGVALMAVDDELDTGGIYAEARVPIGGEATADELRAELGGLGTALLVDALTNGLTPPRPQVGDPTYAEKIAPAELELDWTRPAVELHRIVRVGGAWTTFRGRRLKVTRSAVVVAAEPGARATGAGSDGGELGAITGLDVSCGQGSSFRLVEVQPEGKARQAADAWRNGARPTAGERLGT